MDDKEKIQLLADGFGHLSKGGMALTRDMEAMRTQMNALVKRIEELEAEVDALKSPDADQPR